MMFALGQRLVEKMIFVRLNENKFFSNYINEVNGTHNTHVQR